MGGGEKNKNLQMKGNEKHKTTTIIKKHMKIHGKFSIFPNTGKKNRVKQM